MNSGSNTTYSGLDYFQLHTLNLNKEVTSLVAVKKCFALPPQEALFVFSSDRRQIDRESLARHFNQLYHVFKEYLVYSAKDVG